jgi:AAA+ superfamily predicted ATPase
MAETTDLTSMTREMRYYHLHREEKLVKLRERYATHPDTISKREERERKKAEKEAEYKAKQEDKERIRQEKLQVALATSQRKTKGAKMYHRHSALWLHPVLSPSLSIQMEVSRCSPLCTL